MYVMAGRVPTNIILKMELGCYQKPMGGSLLFFRTVSSFSPLKTRHFHSMLG